MELLDLVVSLIGSDGFKALTTIMLQLSQDVGIKMTSMFKKMIPAIERIMALVAKFWPLLSLVFFFMDAMWPVIVTLVGVLEVLMRVLEPFIPLLQILGRFLILMFVTPMIAIAIAIEGVLRAVGRVAREIGRFTGNKGLQDWGQSVINTSDDIKESIAGMWDSFVSPTELGDFGAGAPSMNFGTPTGEGGSFGGKGPTYNSTTITVEGNADESTIEELDERIADRIYGRGSLSPK